MGILLKVYRFFCLISTDVACGAAVCAAFFARMAHIEIGWAGMVALAITVWIIYSLDHLLDVARLKIKASTARHFFHQRNFKTMGVLVLVAVGLDLCMLLFVYRQIFFWGAALSLLVLVYILVQRWINPFKELVAALLYTCGVLLPTLALHITVLSAPVLWMMGIFFLAALINLVLFSWFELDNDRQNTQGSFVTWFGKRKSKFFLICLFLLQGLLLTMLLLQTSYTWELLILLVMNLVLGVLFFFARRFEKSDSYRLIGDAIFLFPIPYLLWNG